MAVEERRHLGGDVGFKPQEGPAFERELGEHFDLQAQLAAKLGLERQVDIQVHIVDGRPQLPTLVVVAGGEVGHEQLEFVAALLRSDEVDVKTDLPTDTNERRPPADEDGRLEVVTEPVDESPDESVLVFVEARH